MASKMPPVTRDTTRDCHVFMGCRGGVDTYTVKKQICYMYFMSCQLQRSEENEHS